jgi:hypothetical protein
MRRRHLSSARGGSVCLGVIASPDYCFDQFTGTAARYSFRDDTLVRPCARRRILCRERDRQLIGLADESYGDEGMTRVRGDGRALCRGSARQVRGVAVIALATKRSSDLPAAGEPLAAKTIAGSFDYRTSPTATSGSPGVAGGGRAPRHATHRPGPDRFHVRTRLCAQPPAVSVCAACRRTAPVSRRQ